MAVFQTDLCSAAAAVSAKAGRAIAPPTHFMALRRDIALAADFFGWRGLESALMTVGDSAFPIELRREIRRLCSTLAPQVVHAAAVRLQRDVQAASCLERVEQLLVQFPHDLLVFGAEDQVFRFLRIVLDVVK